MWENISKRLQGGPMTWRTHALAGISALWLLEPLPHTLTTANIAPLAVIAAFGALLPDLDASQSKIQTLMVGGIQPFRPIGRVVHSTLGHRGPMHSLFGLGAMAVVSFILGLRVGYLPAVALWLGYASHLAADACTRSGIPLFGGTRRIHLLPKPLRFVTGSAAEDILMPFLAAAVLLLLLAHYPGR
jgi:inner membrane protein